MAIIFIGVQLVSVSGNRTVHTRVAKATRNAAGLGKAAGTRDQIRKLRSGCLSTLRVCESCSELWSPRGSNELPSSSQQISGSLTSNPSFDRHIKCERLSGARHGPSFLVEASGRRCHGAQFQARLCHGRYPSLRTYLIGTDAAPASASSPRQHIITHHPHPSHPAIS
ncbi:hypothetical protein LZ30DRAFT_186667 [Colletotrichum cereale]|nr:hypothetical protein LZ30DRAFT_186667 [Colletotrichum cereale]